MDRFRSFDLGIALTTTAILALGCGQVDHGTPAATWCEEAGVAEVTIMQSLNGGILVDDKIVLTDAAGRTLVEVLAPDAGPEAQRTNYTLDANGNVVEEEFDQGADGTIEGVTTTTYDSEHRPVEAHVDSDGDDVVDAVVTWDYTTDNEVRVVYDRDDGADTIHVSVYSDSGELIREEYDRDADGNPDHVKTYSYSSAGLLVEETEDEGADLSLETLATYVYDDAGRLVYEQVLFDDEGDGPQDRFSTFEYDAAGRLVSRSTDLKIDDVVDEVTTFTYDSQGRLVRAEGWSPVFEDVTTITETAYADGEDPIRIAHDIHGDGTVDIVTTTTACEE